MSSLIKNWMLPKFQQSMRLVDNISLYSHVKIPYQMVKAKNIACDRGNQPPTLNNLKVKSTKIRNRYMRTLPFDQPVHIQNMG